MGMICFTASIFFICIAHLIRIARWRLFIDIYEKPDHAILIRALSMGYVINYFMPLKLGDMVRALIAGKGMKSGRALGFSTVIVDRYLDVVTVGLIFIVLSLSGMGKLGTKDTAYFYAAASLLLVMLMAMIYAFRGIMKELIKVFAGLFNSNIEAAILSFAWVLIWNFKDIFEKINKIRLIFSTIAMWSCYLISYTFLAKYMSLSGIGVTWADIFTLLFAQNGLKESFGITTLFRDGFAAAKPISSIVYILLPPMIVFVLAFFLKRSTRDDDYNYGCLNLFPHLDFKERLDFLDSYFSNKNREYVANYLKINQDISIIRDYSAGSNATTMLCVDTEKTFFRKYAFGEDGDKLYEQILWLKENKDRLPLPEIIKQEKTDLYCYYDMPYRGNTVGFYEYIHSMPVEQGWKMLRNVMECLEQSVYQIDVKPADKETIHQYVQSKVIENLNKIKNARCFRDLCRYETVYINGVAYPNLPAYGRILNERYLQRVFENDGYAVIHGDLTIENIICVRDDRGKDGFYLIDPNTGNIHNSTNLDYGKILQSIHGGYEFLMSVKSVNIVDNRISFPYTRSSAYIELHKLFSEYMAEKFDREKRKSIYFHEMIHWIRLMPYKIKKDERTAGIFYAGMLMVMDDVVKMYGSD